MANLTQFPIKVTDQLANESVQGLCPALLEDVRTISTASTAEVVSEYGFRKALINEIEARVVVNILGDGAKICETSRFDENDLRSKLELRRIKFRGMRFSHTILNRVINLSYDNTPGKTILNATNIGVQGGALHANHTPIFSLNTNVYSAFSTCGSSSNTNYEYIIGQGSFKSKTVCTQARDFSSGYKTSTMNIDEPASSSISLEVLKYTKSSETWDTYGEIWPFGTSTHGIGTYSLFNPDKNIGLVRYWPNNVKTFNVITGAYTAQSAVPTSLNFGGHGHYYAKFGWNVAGGTDSNSGTAYPDFLKFDFNGSFWTTNGPNAPISNFFSGGCTIYDGVYERFFRAGGYTVNEVNIPGISTKQTNEIRVYSYENNTNVWRTETNLLQPRCIGYMTRISKNSAIFMGGCISNWDNNITQAYANSSCITYNSLTQTWNTTGTLPSAKYHMSVYT